MKLSVLKRTPVIFYLAAAVILVAIMAVRMRQNKLLSKRAKVNLILSVVAYVAVVGAGVFMLAGLGKEKEAGIQLGVAVIAPILVYLVSIVVQRAEERK